MHRWIKIDHFACAAPARLRHSWLENQVFMFLRPTSRAGLKAKVLARQIPLWRGYLSELERYVYEFPSVIDPGIFLKYFAAKNGRTVNAATIDKLSTKFADDFEINMNTSLRLFHDQLDTASKKLADSLKQLADEAESCGDIIADKLTSIDIAWDAVTEVHRLLSLVPRGVVLP